MDTFIFRLAAIGITSAVLALVLKKENPVFAMLIALAGSILIFVMVIPRFAVVIELIQLISYNLGDSAVYITTVIKIIGIAYAAEFGASICADAGESGLASHVELAGKLLILAASAPIILTLIRQVLSVL